MQPKVGGAQMSKLQTRPQTFQLQILVDRPYQWSIYYMSMAQTQFLKSQKPNQCNVKQVDHRCLNYRQRPQTSQLQILVKRPYQWPTYYMSLDDTNFKSLNNQLVQCKVGGAQMYKLLTKTIDISILDICGLNRLVASGPYILCMWHRHNF